MGQINKKKHKEMIFKKKEPAGKGILQPDLLSLICDQLFFIALSGERSPEEEHLIAD